MTTRYQETMDKALQCIHLARAINDRYADPTKISAEEVGQRKALLAEAARLKEIAAAEKAQTEMEDWAAEPDRDEPALTAMATAGATKAEQVGGADRASEANTRIATQRFAKAMRSGINALNLEEKAALIEDATGEVLVPHDIAAPIFADLPHLSIFRSANPARRQTTSNKVDVRSLTSGTAAWGKLEVLGTGSGTAAARDATPTPSTPAQVIEVHDLVGLAKIGVDELQDTDANLVALVQQVVGELFAALEDDAFGNGSGTSRPWGLAMRATQASPVITQAVTGTNATPTGDGLKSLQYRMPARFRSAGAYFASTDAAESISLLKDTTSNYLWVPSMRVGDPDTLWGKPFYVLESLPAMGASAAAVDASVIFGNLNAGYLIADRQQITMQRLDELFSMDGQIGFLFKLRVGGDVIRPKAFVKYLL